MAQFAQQLQSMDPGEFPTNGVMDETGLKGAWDFTLNFSPQSLFKNAAPATESAATPSDPNGALSFMEAVRQQLGLKLETRKRPMPVLVIDHIEEQPTDN